MMPTLNLVVKVLIPRLKIKWLSPLIQLILPLTLDQTKPGLLSSGCRLKVAQEKVRTTSLPLVIMIVVQVVAAQIMADHFGLDTSLAIRLESITATTLTMRLATV